MLENLLKILCSLSILLISQSSFAINGFRCNPSMKETRIQVIEKEGRVEVLVSTPMGYEFMPQFEAPMSAFNLDFFKMQAEDLRGLGDSFVYSWDLKNCILKASEFNVQCDGEIKNLTNDIGAFGISTSEITEKSNEMNSEKRKFRMIFEKDNIYFVSLVFDTKNCEIFK